MGQIHLVPIFPKDTAVGQAIHPGPGKALEREDHNLLE